MAVGQRKLAAIMFTDIVGYSALAQTDESMALKLLERHNQILRPVFSRFGGREVKTIGDAFLVEFESALDATHCALEIQRSLHEYNESAPADRRVQIRVGVHVGDVVLSNGDVLGDAVNIASRIEPLAEAGGICITQQVFDQVQNKLPNPLIRLPTQSLKNIRVPVAVYRVVQTWEPAGDGDRDPVAAGGHHLAVLPLANISPDPHDEYFADGLTEELIAVLSQVRDLDVIARTSVAPYKAAPKSIAQVGAELGVDTVLEGSVRKSGNRIRITLQLINVATQGHIWASSYNREVDDVFAVQADIAERTAEALRLKLAAPVGPGATGRSAPDPVAYDLYLKGLVAGMERTEAASVEAAKYFDQATRRDPAFAEAFAAWANMYVSAAGDYLPMRPHQAHARALAARALELDPDSSDAHSALANLVFQFDHDWARAESEFKRAIALNPSNANAHHFLGLMYFSLGRFDEARDELRRFVRLDPAGTGTSTLSLVELAVGNFDAAIEVAEKARDANPTSVGNHTYLGLWYLTAGRRSQALKEADFPVTNASNLERFDHALLAALLGRPEEGRAMAERVERGEHGFYASGADLAMLYSALGEKARALELLEKDYREGDRVLWLYFRGCWFDPIREDPRFVALVREYGLPTDVPPTLAFKS